MNKKYKNSKSQMGFTLVELSIVLIIIGFLIAGIAAGSSLIKSAQLNSVITDFRNYQTSYNNFVGRYAQAPGDSNKGFSIWNTACGDGTATSNACDGNANGIIDSVQEIQAAWVMLSQAGMTNAVAPAMTGTAGSGVSSANSGNAAPGVNMPISKISGAAYEMANGNPAFGTGTAILTGNSSLWASATTKTNINAIFLAKPGSGATATSTTLNNSAITPNDAYSIDAKIDDGTANTGLLRAAGGNDATVGDCLAASGGNYNLSGTNVACIVAMALNQ